MANIEIPVNVGEKIYFYTTFKNKLYILNSPVAEIRTVTGKSGTTYNIVTNTGLLFKNKDLGVLFFTDVEKAKEIAETRIAEVNSANAKLGMWDAISFGGVI